MAPKAKPKALLLLATVLLLAAATPAVADSPAPAGPPTLTVTTSGVGRATPDSATIRISLRRSARTAPAARNRAAETTQGILSAITSLGLDSADVQTSAISVDRRGGRVGRPGHRHRRVFDAGSELTVSTKRIDLIAGIVDAATRAGADHVDGPDFTVVDESTGKLAAIQAAVTEARQRADAAAAALGRRVIGVQSVTLDPAPPGEPITATGSTSPSKRGSRTPPTPTPVSPGSAEITATVTIVFLLST